MEAIHILQLGEEDWNNIFALPQWVQLDYAAHIEGSLMEKSYDMCFLDRSPRAEEIPLLFRAIRAYTLFITEHVEMDEGTTWLCCSRKAQVIAAEELPEFLAKETKYYFARPYGGKLQLTDLSIARGFEGSVKWEGNYGVVLEGDFGEEFRQAAFWRYNIPLEQGQAVDLWLEYSKDSSVSISFEITQFAYGGSEEIAHWSFDEKALQQVICLDSMGSGAAFLSVSARGSGRLCLNALHQRKSRGSHGYFLPGGERYVSSQREEAFCYFDPGDLKPPLCVYFSGYKTLQGFEGYYMMRGMGCPYLLVAEPRLEGGAFYMGSTEYEGFYVDMIWKYMTELGFTADQVVLSGLSMGTYGALYYGCDIKPYALLLGKPLASIGNVAANEKHIRPGGFSTSLDVLMYQGEGAGERGIQALNDKFWDKFEKTDWGNTKFAVSYMLEDDYDRDAYQMLISHMQSEGVEIYGKGLHGRHNDNTNGIVSWFLDQYRRILDEDFGRGNEKNPERGFWKKKRKNPGRGFWKRKRKK